VQMMINLLLFLALGVIVYGVVKATAWWLS
jgi:hypothetical protein